jgi:dolichol-phosphate mannosyltransferase
MYRLWQQGYEVVEGVKESRGRESGAHALAADSFYRLISRATGMDMSNASDFKLLDRKVVDTLNQMPERNVFFRALSYWVGYRKTEVRYAVQERAAGQSKWTTGRLVAYALNNLASFSSAPMQVVTWIGIIFLILSVVLGAQTLLKKFLGHALEGFTTVILIQLISCGLILLSLGIIGFYVARIYEEIKGRPRYIVSETCGNLKNPVPPTKH